MLHSPSLRMLPYSPSLRVLPYSPSLELDPTSHFPLPIHYGPYSPWGSARQWGHRLHGSPLPMESDAGWYPLPANPDRGIAGPGGPINGHLCLPWYLFRFFHPSHPCHPWQKIRLENKVGRNYKTHCRSWAATDMIGREVVRKLPHRLGVVLGEFVRSLACSRMVGGWMWV